MVKLPKLRKMKSKAFTLVETCITLFIFCLIFTLPTINLKDYQNAIKVHNTRRQVKSIIESYSRYAILKNRTYIIQNRPLEHQIRVSYGNEGKVFNLDKDVDVRIPNGNRIKVSDKGHFAPTWISFVCHNKKEVVNVQMMWGRMIDAKD